MISIRKQQRVSKNFAFQFIYQAIVLLIPLIISPFLTRVLGSEQLGIHTYANSIALYFVIFANLGISRYGQREISKCSNDEQISKVFWSLYLLHLAISILSFLLFIGFCFAFVRDNTNIFLIEGVYVLSAAFDVTWLFYGLEDFKKVVVFNAFVKVLECALIFLLIKSPSDIWVYTLIVATGQLVIQLLLLFRGVSIVPFSKITIKDAIKHLKPVAFLSISVIAVSLYTVFDKILLGLLTTQENVAFYEYANRIIVLPTTFITIIGAVLYPRSCRMVEAGDLKSQKVYLKASLLIVSFFGFSSLFGLLSVAKQFAVIYYGEGFAQSGEIMIAMSALPFIVGLGEILRSQYLMPNHLDSKYILCVILNAIINLALSAILIPIIGVYGAVIGTTAAELFGLLFQVVVCRKLVQPLLILKTAVPFLLMGVLMYFALFFLSFCLDQSAISLIVKIVVGFIVYSVLAVLYVAFFEKDIWKMTFGKLKSVFIKNE